MRVVGAIEGNPPVVVVENLPREGAAEVVGTICAQAAVALRRKVDGTVLRVTQDRSDRPGTDARETGVRVQFDLSSRFSATGVRNAG